MALRSRTGRSRAGGLLSGLQSVAVALTFHKPYLDISCAIGILAMLYSIFFPIPIIVSYGLSIFVGLIGLSAVLSSYQLTLFHIERFKGYVRRQTDTYWTILGQGIFWKWWLWFIVRGLLVIGIAVLLFPPVMPFITSAYR